MNRQSARGNAPTLVVMVLVVAACLNSVFSHRQISEKGTGTVDVVAKDRLRHGKNVIRKSSPRADDKVDELLALGYIPNPVPTSVEEMVGVDTAGMEKGKLYDGQLIYTYPSAEDKFVSGMLQKRHDWEGDAVRNIVAEFGSVGRADFLDVGANLGSYSLPVARYLKEKNLGGRVIAVEGLPHIAKHLDASVVANGLQDTIDIYQYAVSDGEMSADEVSMNLAPTNKGGSSVLGNKPKGLVEGGDVQNGTVVKAKVTTLDSILQRGDDAPKIFAVKMDIEGSEGRALNGAREFLSKSAPCVLQIELNEDWLSRAGTPRDSVLGMLRDVGFDTPTSIQEEMVTTTFRQKNFDKCVERFAQ